MDPIETANAQKTAMLMLDCIDSMCKVTGQMSEQEFNLAMYAIALTCSGLIVQQCKGDEEIIEENVDQLRKHVLNNCVTAVRRTQH